MTCGTYLYNFFNKTNIEPPEFNEMMKEAGGFVADRTGDKCLINSYVMAKVIGIKYLGREHNLNQYPELNGIETPTIKEVDYSYRQGHQQHFVIRIHDKNGNYILDTLGGVRRAINYYEIKMSPDYEGWGGLGDAHEYLLKHYKDFDFIWSSPPCQSHSSFRHNICVRFRGTEEKYPDMRLYE